MRYWSLSLALLSWLLPASLLARELVFGLGIAGDHVLWPKLQAYVDRVADKAGQNLHIELKPTPFLRIQELIQKGEMDGDVGRLREVYEGNEKVVLVDEPTAMLRLFFIFHKDQVLTEIEDLRHQKVLAAKDILFFRRACTELKLDCEFVGSGTNTMSMLRLKRIGAVLATQYQLPEMMRQSGDPSLFRLSDKNWYAEPVYLFLAKKNADLAPKLASALKELKQNGTYRKIFGMDP